MAKQKVHYICSACGYSALKWFGRCPECGQWNSAEEHIQQSVATEEHHLFLSSPKGRVQSLADVTVEKTPRLLSGIDEFDRVMGGGATIGGYTLLSGPPGVGKSTLMHQIALAYAEAGFSVLYLSAEESPPQIKQRFMRLAGEKPMPESLLISDESNLDRLSAAIDGKQIDILFADSVQTVYVPTVQGIPGSVSQVKECSVRLMDFAKKRGLTVFVIGHVTKSGSIAGPMLLEHMVDTVLYFEGDISLGYRLLRISKNRFGPTDEVALFTMTGNGLEPVRDPGRFFISEEEHPSSGSVMSLMLEGTRPFLIEIQALAHSSNFPQPRRVLTGFDTNRVAMIVAVLEKRMDLFLSGMDIYLNVVGGIKIKSPSVDLPVAAALIASVMNIVLPKDIAFIGEIGLGGEIRRISGTDVMIKEAERLGVKRLCLPAARERNAVKVKNLELLRVKTLFDVMEIIRSLSPFD